MKQTDFTEEFLQKYRELESAVVRVMGDGNTVRDFEEEHPDMADRLRLLRQVRNYATHSTNISEFTAEYGDTHMSRKKQEIRAVDDGGYKTLWALAAYKAIDVAPVGHVLVSLEQIA